MSKQLRILGCGHSESIQHFNNNAVILTPMGNMLIDSGHTIKHALHAQEMSIADIDAIFITHVHGDHVFGLERIAYEAKFNYNKRIKLILHESIFNELWHETLKGSLSRIGEGSCTLEDYFDVELLTEHYFNLYKTHFELVPVKHTPNKPTFGLIIDKKLFFSSDTTVIPDVILNSKFEYIFHDVTLTEFNPVHAPLNELIKCYPLSIRKKMYLMSYQDNYEEFESVVNKEFKGFAYQGQTLDF